MIEISALNGRALSTTTISGTSDPCTGIAGSITSMAPKASRIDLTALALTGIAASEPIPAVPGPTSPAVCAVFAGLASTSWVLTVVIASLCAG